MNRYACQYAIIRFLPYAETGEFANVGVALACPSTGYFDARLMEPRRTGRITGFFEQLDKRIYREAMAYLKEELQRLRMMVRVRADANAQQFVQQAFADLTRPREALLRFSGTRVILAERPDETLNQLFARVVERDFADKTYHDRMLDRGVRETLRKANLRDYFRPADIGNDDVHIRVPFVYELEGTAQLAIKPLDLAKDEANQVFESGGHWVERVRRLGRHHVLPEAMLFAVKMPPPEFDRAHRAANEILEDLGKQGVQIADIENTHAITAFAAGAVRS